MQILKMIINKQNYTITKILTRGPGTQGCQQQQLTYEFHLQWGKFWIVQNQLVWRGNFDLIRYFWASHLGEL
jgi:hypothetical protein